MNYKEFLDWFFLRRSFKYAKAGGMAYTIPLNRSIAGFQKLGIRLSRNAIKKSSYVFDATSNDKMMNIYTAFDIAIMEEM